MYTCDPKSKNAANGTSLQLPCQFPKQLTETQLELTDTETQSNDIESKCLIMGCLCGVRCVKSQWLKKGSKGLESPHALTDLTLGHP